MIHAVRRTKSMRQAVKIYMLSSLLSFLCLSLFLVNAQAGLSEDTEKCIREGVKRGIIAEKDMLNSAVYKLKASGAKCEDKDDIIEKLKEDPVFIDHALPKIQTKHQTHPSLRQSYDHVQPCSSQKGEQSPDQSGLHFYNRYDRTVRCGQLGSVDQDDQELHRRD